jgi:hypothetical protein
MACAACARQRANVTNNLARGNILGAVNATIKGVGMMAGVVAKPNATPSQKQPVQAVRAPFPNLLKTSSSNADRGHGKK